MTWVGSEFEDVSIPHCHCEARTSAVLCAIILANIKLAVDGQKYLQTAAMWCVGVKDFDFF